MFRLVAAFVALFMAAVPAQAEEIKLTHNGHSVHAELVLAEGKTLKDRIVLLTHGTLAHNKMELIVAMQTLLEERGISSLAINLSYNVSERTGMYDCGVPITHKHTDALDEIGLWLNWLKDQGSTNVVLAGHSRGGNQTAWFAAERMDPVVSQVVLVAPATWYADKAAKGFKKTHGRDLDGAMAEAKKAGPKMLKGMGAIYCAGADITGDAFLNYYTVDDRFHTPNLLAKITKPVLIVVGTEDTVVAGLTESVAPMVDGKKLSFVAVDDAGHFFLDLYGEELADAMDEFMNP